MAVKREDLSCLEKFDADSVLEVLRSRYANDEIYTNCGEILLAVNPYKTLPIFDNENHEQYDWKRFEANMPPHIFNVAARAYQRIQEAKTNQVILVSGESGAGKTESTKLMVKHLVYMSPNGNDDLHNKIVQVNPLLEAFGNAQTIINDNSSRFAKFLELSFDESGQVIGAAIRDYMLEKARVVTCNEGERNFHIFYYLFAGASKQQLSDLNLSESKNYRIMKGGRLKLLEEKPKYREKYTQQMDALKRIGFDDDDMNILHCMLGAIIHLTEVKFKEADKVNEPLEIVNIDQVDLAAQLLNVKPLELCLALIKTKTEYGGLCKGGEPIYYLKNLEQARDSCDALAKAIYERMFGWVIRRINEALNPTNQRKKVAASIGILDIAGFENFPVNSFGQLCINFVNERLQNFMNDHVFKNEKRLYRDEGIPLEDIDFKNNEDIIDTFLKKPFGLLNLLDEETKFRQGSDAGFVFKVTTNHDKSEIIKKTRNDDPVFTVCHFAGKVDYDCHGFLDKNKDTLNDDLLECMKVSENVFISDLFTIKKGPTGTISEAQCDLRQSKKVRTIYTRQLSQDLGKSLKKFSWSVQEPHRDNANTHKTVISYFKESMDKLLSKMKHAEAHFVRCIKPNEQKQGNNFNAQYVKKQLLYNGITEIAKIRKNGYPIRKTHMDFYNRFFVLHSEFSKKHPQNPAQTNKLLLDKVIPDDLKKECKIGKHRVFMREPVHLCLEKQLYHREKLSGILHTMWLGMKARKLFREMKSKVEFEKKKENDEKKETVLQTIFEDQPSDTQTQKDGHTSKNIWHNVVSSQTNHHGETDPPQLRQRIREDNKFPSKTRQDIGTGSIYPDHHIDVNTVDTEEQKKKESKGKEKPFWDIFNNIPREMKSKDVHERSSLRVIKVFIYGLLFLLVFCSLVVQKISLMLLVNYENEERNNITISENGTEYTTQVEGVDLPHVKHFLLVLAICIPYTLTVVFGLLRVLFGNIKSPAMQTMLVVLTIECMHSVGIGFLVFKVLGELHAAYGIMALNTTCFVPSVLNLFPSRATANGDSVKKCLKACRKVTDTIINILAFAAQISVIPLVIYFGVYKMDVSTEETIYSICCFLLCSLSWWENFLPDGSKKKNTLPDGTEMNKTLTDRSKKNNTSTDGTEKNNTSTHKFDQTILSIQFDLQESRPFITAISSLLKIGVTILTGVFLPEPDLNLVTGWKDLTSDEIFKFTPIICITTCSFVAFFMAYIACRLKLQVFSFSLACFLSTPFAVGIAMIDCEYNILSAFTKDSLNCQVEGSIDLYMYFIWGFILFVSIYWIARHIWSPNQERLAKMDKLFVNPLYCSILLEQHLLMNRRRYVRRIRKEVENGVELTENDSASGASVITVEENKTPLKKIPPMIYACATMWHENRQEMVQLLKSLYRVDTDQYIRQKALETYISLNKGEEVNTEAFEYYEFEAHILFDDAYELDDNEEEMVPNKFVRDFTDVMQEAANAILKKHIELRKPRIISSPYGAQLVFLLPGNNLMYVHLKDKNKIRHRKRWSQVMYMYYLLGYRLTNASKEKTKISIKEDTFGDYITWNTKPNGGIFEKSQIFNILDDEIVNRAENTFILALDGDVDFTPKAVRLLVDRMVTNEQLGAACGRIHPIGKGPMVWYQKFEYAVAHWLQKSTEHVLGCVLCSPGCFSLFRGSALMDDNVMRKYTIKPTEASHHLMYDQGEDRWLCTLLLQQGYRVDYAAASDAYTYAPEGFGEFFNQRRRWMPSTIANIMDLLTDARNTVSINNNISWLFMIYQGALMLSTLIGPSTVIMMIAGAYLTVFQMNLLTSYAIALSPAILYTILCFTVKPKYQIITAEIFSAIYSFIMMVVFVGCIITAVKQSPFHPSVIFLCSMVFIFLFAAVIHPWEFSCIFYGLLYFLCVPSGFLLLIIYSLCNMNSVSWGTREVAKKKTQKEKDEEEINKKENEKKKKQKSWLKRLMPVIQLKDLRSILELTKNETKTKEDRGIQTEDLNEVVVETNKRKTVSWLDKTPDEPTHEQTGITPTTDKPFDVRHKPKWTEDKDFKDGKIMSMTPKETIFWEEFIKRYLKPLDANKKEQETMKQALAQLRNEVVAGFAFINLIWISINFMFQLRKPAVIEFPTASGAENVDDDVIKIDALGLMFIIFFVLILLLQFIGMIFHRLGTLMHLIAITEIPNPFKCGKKQSYGNMEEENTEKLNAKELVRFYTDVVGEPMPDYSGDEDDDDDEKDAKIEKELSDTIVNNAVIGVKGNIGGTRKPGLGMSFRETMANKDSIPNNLRSTTSKPNFRQTVRNMIAISRRKYDEGTKPFPKGNVLRYRKNHPPMSRTDWEQAKKFGSNKPVFHDMINEIQNDRDLKHKVRGLENQTTGVNLRRTYRREASATDLDEPINDNLSGAVGTLDRTLYKNLNKKIKVQTRQNPVSIASNSGSRLCLRETTETITSL
ncbi:chitin synthase chs-2-like [Mytilus galloprovincialis]|uniref:chitin synthase chs-2-like n=1 Tax=Mytilus galloprovincialis TaxID=29158 RepID=UPI003F7BCA85